MRFDSCGDAADRFGRGHADVVADDDATEADFLAQDVADPDF